MLFWWQLTEPLNKTRASASDQSAVLGGDQRLSLSGGYRSFISSSGTAAALGGADCDRTSPANTQRFPSVGVRHPRQKCMFGVPGEVFQNNNNNNNDNRV